MAIVNGIGSILMAIINGIVTIFDVVRLSPFQVPARSYVLGMQC